MPITLSPAQVREILARHQAWIASNGTAGVRADLAGANLNRAELQNAALQHADMREAILSGAQLRGANLSGANLQRALFYRPICAMQTSKVPI